MTSRIFLGFYGRLLTCASMIFFALWWGVTESYAQAEGQHLELYNTELKISSMDPFTVEGGIVLENQGGAALTIRGFQSGTASRVDVTKTSKFLGLFERERSVQSIRVNAKSKRYLTAENGYNFRFTGYPATYGNLGMFSFYVDLGPDNDERWDERGQLMILRYDKKKPID